NYALFVINFAKADFDNFAVAGLYHPPDVLRFDGHFAVAAVNEHAKRNAARSTKVKEAIHGGADGAASVKDVVYEDQVHAVHAKRNFRRLQDRLRGDLGEVIAVERDVECADRNFYAVDATHGLCDALGKGNATAADADQCKVFGAAAFFYDFMGHA